MVDLCSKVNSGVNCSVQMEMASEKIEHEQMEYYKLNLKFFL
jgi:hypothetical protein